MIGIVESHFDPKDFRWKENRIRRRKRLDGEIANDEHGFFLAIDNVQQGLNERFSDRRHSLEAVHFHPANSQNCQRKFSTPSHKLYKIKLNSLFQKQAGSLPMCKCAV